MVKKITAIGDGVLGLVNDPIGSGAGDEFELYEDVEAGRSRNPIKVNKSPYWTPSTKELNFVHYHLHIVAGPSANRALISLLAACCHQVRLLAPHGAYTAYLPKQFYDAFDFENSRYDRFDDETRSISNIKKVVLRQSALGEAAVFKIAGDRACRVPTYASDRFFDLYNEVGGTGLKFWDVEVS